MPQTFPRIVALVVATSAASASAQTSWPVGVEREVDEGTYMRVYAVQDGWRIWRVETKDGHQCNAVKSARGRPHPIPVGVQDMMFGGTPFLIVSNEKRKDFRGDPKPGEITYRWMTVHYGDVRVRVRLPGAKFWDEYGGSYADMSKYQEGAVEVALSSWEYPEIYAGNAEERGIFDLKGVGWAIGKIGECNA